MARQHGIRAGGWTAVSGGMGRRAGGRSQDDTDDRRDRVSGFTPTRIQAQDRGAASFEKMEGIWAEPRGPTVTTTIAGGACIFACSDGGAIDMGAVWEADPGRETLTMIYESVDPARLEHPDNVVIVPHTGDVFLQEDGNGDQFIRGVTRTGRSTTSARP